MKEEIPVIFSAALLPCPRGTGQGPRYPSPRSRSPGTGVSHCSETSTRLCVKYPWAPSPPANSRRIASSVSFPSLKSKQEGRKSSLACRQPVPWVPVLSGAAHRGCQALGGTPHLGEHCTCFQTYDKRSLLFFRVSCCLRFLFAF